MRCDFLVRRLKFTSLSTHVGAHWDIFTQKARIYCRGIIRGKRRPCVCIGNTLIVRNRLPWIFCRWTLAERMSWHFCRAGVWTRWRGWLRPKGGWRRSECRSRARCSRPTRCLDHLPRLKTLLLQNLPFCFKYWFSYSCDIPSGIRRVHRECKKIKWVHHLTNISVLVMHFISLKGIFTDRDYTRIVSIFFGNITSNCNWNI